MTRPMKKLLGVFLLLGISACDGLPFGSEEREASGGCQIGGCSNEICAEGNEKISSDCSWQESYACFDSAVCDRQSNGTCGWTQTEELSACLSSAE